MPLTYERADDSTTWMLAEAMRRYHPMLVAVGITVNVLMVHEIDGQTGEALQALKVNRYPAAAAIKVNNLKLRALGLADLLLEVDAFTWDDLGEAERFALMDHELTHVLVCAEKPDKWVGWNDAEQRILGRVAVDDLRRPKLKLRLHDWHLQGFKAVANRHKSAALEVQAARASRDELGQYKWDWHVDAANDLIERMGGERVEPAAKRDVSTATTEPH